MYLFFSYYSFMSIYRERPAAIPIEIKSIDDTSNFDEFPESDILQPGETATVNSKFLSIMCQNASWVRSFLLFLLTFLMS